MIYYEQFYYVKHALKILSVMAHVVHCIDETPAIQSSIMHLDVYIYKSKFLDL